MTQLEIGLSKEDRDNISFIKNELEFIKTQLKPKEPPVYLSRNEVADLFKIDLSTVHNWTKKGTIIAHQIGGRIFFKREDLEKALVRLNN